MSRVGGPRVVCGQRGYTTMANRRKFIAGLGALATGSAAAMGTGAFTSVSAERDVSVSVVGDGDAYLRMVPDGSQYSSLAANGEIEVGFDSLNTDAFSEFHDVFAIQNQGDQDAAIFLDSGDGDTAEHTGDLKGTIAPNLEEAGVDISFGIYNDAVEGGGNPNGATAAPSNYRNGGNDLNDGGRSFVDSNPYVLSPGDVFRPDMYFETDGDDAGTTVTGTLRVLGFTKEWVAAGKGP